MASRRVRSRAHPMRPLDPPTYCECLGDSEVLNGGLVADTAYDPDPGRRAKGDLDSTRSLTLPYYLRRRRCLDCGKTWSTVEVRLHDLPPLLRP